METHYHLTHLPPVDQKTIAAGINALYPDAESTEGPAGMVKALRVEAVDFKKTKFCQDLVKQFGPIVSFYLKNNPKTIFDWHKDRTRNCGINFVLTDVNGLTLFKTRSQGIISDLDVCDYILYKPTIINTTMEHCAINYSNQDRIVLSVGLGLDVFYDDVKSFLLNYHCDNY